MLLYRILCRKSISSRLYYISQPILQKRCKTHLAAAVNAEQWEPVIGLEIHAQINSQSKLFSGSESQFAAPANTLVSLFDASIPGTLPVLNRRCVEAGLRTALALNSNINLVSLFDRKHYFYADLPAGYQITQQRCPLATGGYIKYRVPQINSAASGKTLKAEGFSPLKMARLIQLQLEQDSGKSLHDMEQGYSLIDLNRAGVALMEIVTEPDFSTAHEAMAFVKELQRILLAIGSCNCRMEEGSLRVDASVSVRRPGDKLGTRAEVKNLNSIRALGRAIDYEIKRQTEVVEQGGEVVNETRGFNTETGETVAMRDKERLHDYRFMPEPNLPPLNVYNTDTVAQGLKSGVPINEMLNIDDLKSSLPELPSERRERLVREYNLSQQHSDILVNETGLSELFEDSVRLGAYVRGTAVLLITDLLAVLNDRDISLAQSGMTAEHVKDLVEVLQTGFISNEATRQVLEGLIDGRMKQTVSQLVGEFGLEQCNDHEIISQACQQLIDDHPKEVAQYKRGKLKLMNFFVGRALNKFDRKVNAKMVTEILKEKLS